MDLIFDELGFDGEEEKAKRKWELIKALLRRQLDEEELKVLNHVEEMNRLGITPVPPPPGMEQEHADIVAMDIELKLADIVSKLEAIEVPPIGTYSVEMTPETEAPDGKD